MIYRRIALVFRTAFVFAVCCSTILAQDEFVVPIAASSPHVFMALTDDIDPDEGVFTSEARFPPRGNYLPFDQETNFEVAVFDTGSPATIMGHDESENYGIVSSGFGGTEITPIGGVGELVNAINSDPVGVFVAGVDALLTNPRNGEQTIDKSQLKGSITNSVLYGDTGVALPNLIGTSTSTFYTTVMNYGDPKITEYEGETYRTPAVTMHELGTLPRPDRRIGLTLEPGAFGAPAFLINLGGIAGGNDLRENPSAPTVAGSFFIGADITNNGVSRSPKAILDTGAQGSIVSEQLAAELGFDVINDDPDFVVRIAGVTGQSEEVPGFYADEFFLPGTDGGLRLKNVPLIVFNLTDPRDATNTLPALLGMNVFGNRDITLNPEPGGAYLGISDPSLIRHTWSATGPTADWATPDSWSDAGVPAIDWYADVANSGSTPQTAIIREDSSVAMLVTKGNASNPSGTMTVDVQQGKTLTLFGTAIIQEGSTLHLNDATLSPLAVEIRGGTISGSGNVEGEVLSQGTLIPGGQGGTGTLAFPGSVDQLTKGTLIVELGDNSDRENLQYDKLDVDGAMSVNGKLDILTLDSYQPGEGETDSFAIISADDDLFGEFAEYTFDGVPLEREFRVGADRRALRDHIADGRFLTINYPANGVEVVHYNALPGDADGNGDVSFDDFLVMSINFSQEADWVGGDFSGDGTVQFEDFLALSANFGAVAAASVAEVASIPEPASWCVGLIGYIALLPFRRRR